MAGLGTRISRQICEIERSTKWLRKLQRAKSTSPLQSLHVCGHTFMVKIFHYPSFCSFSFSFYLSLSFLLPFFFLSSSFLSSPISFIFLPFSSHPFSIFIFRSLYPSCPFPFFFSFPFLFLFFSSLPSIFSFFLFLSSSSDGWMRCVKRPRAKTLQMPDRIFLMGLQAFAFHRERSAKEVVLTCLPQKPPLWPVRIDFSHLPGEGL